MKRLVLAALIGLAMAGAVQAQTQTVAALQAQLAAVDAQLMQMRAAAMQSNTLSTLHIALITASAAYDAAVARIPDVQAADAEMAQLQARIQTVVQRRVAAMDANKATLAPLRQARDDAATACQSATTGGAQGAALLAHRALLLQQLSQAQHAAGNTPAPAPVATP